MSAASVRILHLTDTHIAAGGAFHGGVDTCSALRAVLARARAAKPDVVVVSGDVSDDGSPESYRLARRLVHQWADPLGAAVIWAMGNHDRRAGFREVLCAEPGEPDELAGQGEDRAIYGCVTVRGCDFLVLDTAVEGFSYGHVDRGQLGWLEDCLRARPQTPAVLIMHHPLVPAATELMNGLALDNPGDVAALMGNTRVRAVLSGHYHTILVSTVCGGITTVVGAPVTAQTDALGDPSRERAVRGSGACMVDVDPRLPSGAGDVRVLPFGVPDPAGEGTVFEIPPSDVARIIRRSGAPGFRDARQANGIDS